jgi:hypothetical protein
MPAQFAVAVICLLFSSCVSLTDASENDKRLITEMSKARAKAFNEGNAAAIAIHFTMTPC